MAPRSAHQSGTMWANECCATGDSCTANCFLCGERRKSFLSANDQKKRIEKTSECVLGALISRRSPSRRIRAPKTHSFVFSLLLLLASALKKLFSFSANDPIDQF